MKDFSTVVAIPVQSTINIFITLGVIFLITLQVLDGLLTYLGVSSLGPKFEGNPLLRMGMELIGLEITLVAAKAVAILCALFFLLLPNSRTSLVSVWGLNFFYLFFAVIPWSVVLISMS